MRTRIGRYIFVVLLPMLLFGGSMLVPVQTPQAQVKEAAQVPQLVDPEGESTVAYTLKFAGGDVIPNTTTGVYVLDDQSVVITGAGTANTNESRGYQVDVNLDTNTFTTTLLPSTARAPTPLDLPQVWEAVVVVETYNADTRRPQVRTTDVLEYRIADGTVGYTCWADRCQVFPPAVTGALTWFVVKCSNDPPFTTDFLHRNIFQDTNAKYKNFDYGDPNLSTVVVHSIQIDKSLINYDPDPAYRWSATHKVKNEARKQFYGRIYINPFQTPGVGNC